MRRDHIGADIGEELLANRLPTKRGIAKTTTDAEASPAEWLLRASEAYRSLKSNFATLGRTEDTSWAHYHQRRALGRHYWAKWSTEKDRAALWRVGVDLLYRGTTGYGERPLRPLATAGVMIMLFALIFFGAGFWTGDSFSLWDSLIYSGGSFFTVGFAGFEVRCWFTQLLTLVEAAAGIILLGLFIWTIGNAAGRF